jgi:hypothetical protein
MEFWGELAQSHPSLSQLDAVGMEYEHCVRVTERSFLTILRLEPNSLFALRGYAQFLMEVGAGVQSKSKCTLN